MNIEVLAPEQWEPLLATTGYADTSRLQRLVAAVHGHHAGLPAPAAAAWLRGDAQGLRSGVHQRLQDALTRVPKDDGMPPPRAFRSNFLETLPVSLVVMRGLVPLTLAACGRIGMNILFGQTASPGATDAARTYADYAQRLGQTLVEFTRDDKGLGRPFWDKLAFELMAAAETSARVPRTWQHATQLGNDAVPPDVDNGVVHFVKTLEPTFDRGMLTMRPRLRQQQINLQKVPLKQGGVRGIRMTRSMGDVSDRLVSELVQPSVIRLDRLINAGFLVHHRPPPLDQRRDLLLVGLVHKASTASGAAFAKAVWLDAAERLAVLLVRARLDKSDLVHITRMDEHAAVRVSVGVEAHRQERINLDPFAFGARDRLAMLRTHGWLPGFLDTNPKLLPAVRTAAQPFGVSSSGGTAMLKEVDHCTRAVFQGFPAAAGPTAVDRERVFARYGTVHLQLFLSQDQARNVESGASLRGLAQTLGLPGSSAQKIVVIGVPERAMDSFTVLRARRPPRQIDGVDKAAMRILDKVAADLSTALLDSALEALDA